MPPVPPEGWYRVSISWLVPAHTVPTKEGPPAKVGDALENLTKTVCPGCSSLLDEISGSDRD